MRPFSLLLALAPLALVACDSADTPGNGSAINLDAKGDKGESVTASVDEQGKAKVDIPGFKAEIDLPKIKLDADDFEMNGVKLYPGSTIRAISIKADEKDKAKNGLNVTFDAPGDAKVVQDWFATNLTGKAGYKLTASGNTLSGTDEDGGAFAMTLEPAGPGKTSGTIIAAGSDLPAEEH